MDFVKMREIAHNDVDVLIEKGKKYGDSWKKRGGIGAYMMLARKTDRLEVAVKEQGYDIFDAIEADNFQEDGLLDDIADLRRYLLLVETEMRMRNDQDHHMIEKESHLYKAAQSAVRDIEDAEVMKARYVETPPGAFKAETSPGAFKAETGGVAAKPLPLLDISEQPKAVPIYIDFIEIPPDDFDHVRAVKNSWSWTREEDDRSAIIHWPSSYNALMCPAKAGIKWLYKGKLYTVTENSAPVIVNGIWVWEVLAIPDDETTTLKGQAPGTGF